MSDVRIEHRDGGKISLYSPFNSDFPAAARQIGGDWKGSDLGWVFDARDLDRVRALAKKFFGTDGSPEESGDLVTVRLPMINCGWDAKRGKESAIFAGRIIAEKTARDLPPRLAANVVVVEGKLPSYGGSVANPRMEDLGGVVIEIRDLPRAALSLVPEDAYEIVGETVNVEALQAERETLLARITEIDRILQREPIIADTTEKPAFDPANDPTGPTTWEEGAEYR